jgi:hypothetical protein
MLAAVVGANTSSSLSTVAMRSLRRTDILSLNCRGEHVFGGSCIIHDRMSLEISRELLDSFLI